MDETEVVIRDEDVCIFQGGDRITLESVVEVEQLINDLQNVLTVFKKQIEGLING